MANEDKGRLWLFKNKYKKSDNQPYLTGNGELSGDVIRKLAEYYNKHKGTDVLKNQVFVRLDAAAWQKVSNDGNTPYTFITFEIDIPRERNDSGGEVSEPKDESDIPF